MFVCVQEAQARHIEQLQPRHGTEEDKDPGEIYPVNSDTPQNESEALTDETTETSQEPPTSTMEYRPENPRRSQRKRKKKFLMLVNQNVRLFVELQGWRGDVMVLNAPYSQLLFGVYTTHENFSHLFH